MLRITTTVYDLDGEVTESIDPMLRITTTVYDLDGEVTESIDPMLRITTTVYDLDGEVTESIDPMLRITTTVYDLDGEVTESIDPMLRITTTVYDLDGEVTESIDPMLRTTTTIYDLDGEVTESIDPMLRITTTVYDLDGEVTESIDPMLRITTTVYDLDGEVTESIDPLGNVSTTLYDADGEVTETIDPLGHMTTTLYDADGEVTETIDALRGMTTTLYDADGEVTEIVDPLGHTTTTLYDADREVTETIDALGRVTTTLYDADGEVTETVDPMGDTTTTLYDADGEVTETIDPLGHATTTLYDADGEITETMDPDGNVTTTVYDADGEVTETINPLGNVTTTLYDADGVVTEIVDALGRMTTSLYDADGRLVSETWYNASDVVGNTDSYTYDADGNMLTAQNDAGTYTMTYDALNRLITSEDPFGLTLTYTYDSDGNKIETQDSLGGVTTYTYDADNELVNEQFGGTGQTPLALSMTYDADGELLSEIHYRNLAETQVVGVTSYSYNADGQITSILDQNAGGTTVAEFTYTYDLDNRALTETNTQAGTVITTTYTYNADSELTSEDSSLDPSTIYYNYDADGNRIGDVIGQDNQILNDGTWSYTYDADGNLIEKAGDSGGPEHGITWTYTYNNANQMTSAVEVQGSSTLASVTYTYDSLGNRIEEDYTSGSSTQVTRFAYDGQNVWADLDGSNNLITRRLFLSTVDSVTARVSANGIVAWYLTDRLGSVRALTNATGTVIDRIDYDGFGNIIYESNPGISDRYLFTGREFDRVTGLQYNRARYYDPKTGRWTSQDPLGLAAGDDNLYRYVNNDPTNASDPSGLVIKTHCRIDDYLKTIDGLADYKVPPQDQKEGPFTYSGNATFTAGLNQEIYATMIRSERTFEIKGTTIKETVENLKLHVKARMEIVANTKKATWKFNVEEKWNPDKWAAIFVPKAGTSASDALSDFFTNKDKYSTACLDATLVVMLNSIASVLPDKEKMEFNNLYNATAEMTAKERVNSLVDKFLLRMATKDYKDWVPGDWGYLVNGLYLQAGLDDAEFKKLGGSPGEEGENIIYVGDQKFWGFPIGDKTFDQWRNIVHDWNKKEEKLRNSRDVPPVGLVRPDQ